MCIILDNKEADNKKYELRINEFDDKLGIIRNFDLKRREIIFGQQKMSMYFTDGGTDRKSVV